MLDASSWLEFVRLPGFIRGSKGLLDEDDEARLEQELLKNPHAGAVIAGTGGLRKYRFAIGNRGKRRSARIIYYRLGRRGRIYLIKVYTKADKSSLTPAEKNELKRLTHSLDAES